MLVLLMLLSSSIAKAWDLELEGKIGNYPIIVQMNVPNDNDGRVSGRYAFVSTLKRDGADKKSSWLYFKSKNKFQTAYTVCDYKNVTVEEWVDVTWDDYRNTFSFYGNVITSSGKSYKLDVSCGYFDMSQKATGFFLE